MVKSNEENRRGGMFSGMNTFLLIWAGQLVSMLGSGLTNFALGVWIYEKTGEATPFAITIFFGALPYLLLLPVAGSLADRWNRRWLMIIADSGNALTTLAILLLVTFGDLQVWQVYLLAAVGSTFGTFQEPAYSASITQLVPKDKLARANGMLQTSEAIAAIATPLLAGILFDLLQISGIALIDFITYFFAIGTLLAVRIRQPAVEKPADGQKAGVWSDLRFSWQYLRQRSGLLILLSYYAMVNFLMNLSGALRTPMVLAAHSASILGVVQMVTGIGVLAGSMLMSVWGGPKQRRIPHVILFICLAMAGLGLSGWGAHWIFPAAGSFIMMVFIPLASGTSQVVWQTKVAPAVQGRVFSLRAMVAHSMMPLAYLASGPLADRLFEPWMQAGGALAGGLPGQLLGSGAGRGIGLIFVLSAFLTLAVSALAYASPRLRNVEDELPDALPG